MPGKEIWAPWEIEEFRERIHQVFDEMEVIYGTPDSDLIIPSSAEDNTSEVINE